VISSEEAIDPEDALQRLSALHPNSELLNVVQEHLAEGKTTKKSPVLYMFFVGGFLTEDGILCLETGEPVTDLDGTPIILGNTYWTVLALDFVRFLPRAQTLFRYRANGGIYGSANWRRSENCEAEER